MPVMFETLKPAARVRIGGRGLYATSLARLPDGALIASPHIGNPDVQRVSIWHSIDEGLTWQQIDTRGDELYGAGTALHCLTDGSLLLHTGTLYRSADGGTSWRRIACPAVGVVRNIVTHTDGTLEIYGAHTDWHAGHEPPPETLQGIATGYRQKSAGARVDRRNWRTRSTDAGETWSPLELLHEEDHQINDDLDWESLQPTLHEASVLTLSASHLLAATRRTDPQRTVLIESRDAGATWSAPRELLGSGEIHGHLLDLGDGRILCTYARHELPRGIYAIVSDDRGATWDVDHPTLLAHSLAEFYGWPTSIRMDDGTIMTSYTIKGYEETTHVNDSATEVVRWALRDDGQHVEPASATVFAEPHDYTKYVSGITGFTGRSLQQVAYWQLQKAQRFHITAYKGAMSRFADGELLACNFQDERTVIYRSQDDGTTWQKVQTKGAPIPGKEQEMLCLSDGRTVLIQTEASPQVLYRSADRGVTWQAIRYGHPMPTTRNFIELSDGSIVKFGFKGVWGDQPNAPRATAWRLRSVDGGLTWPHRDEVSTWESSQMFLAEASILAFSDTHFLASARAGGNVVRRLAGAPPIGIGRGAGGETDEGMVVMESQDGGLTWSKPRWMGLGYSAVHSQLTRLADGRILCTYRRRFLPFGVSAVLSSDNGKTWDNDHPILLGSRPTAYGGWPTTLQLPDGTMLTCRGYIWQWPQPRFEIIRWHLPAR